MLLDVHENGGYTIEKRLATLREGTITDGDPATYC